MRSVSTRQVIGLGLLLVVGLGFVLFLERPSKFALTDSPSLTPQSASSHDPVEDPRASYQGVQRVLNKFDPRAFPGFTIIPQSGNEKVQLVNMIGETVHEWDFDAARARLLPNCNLLVVHGSKWGLMREPWRELRKHVREYSWDGELLWEYVSKSPAHHDVQRLANGNTLFLHRTIVPQDKMGRLKNKELLDYKIRGDGLREVTPDGEVVWQWRMHEHFDLNQCGAESCPPISKAMRKRNKDYDWTHVNTSTLIPANQWYDQGDTRFRPGNVMILARTWSQAIIIDRLTGEPVWRYHGDYKGGVSGGHEAHMIEPGLPGAGNILIFDNGRDDGASYALEVNPVTEELVWVYDVGPEFYSDVAGTLQRLPNGNTLISEDVRGRTFEVTPEKEIVWEVQNPFRTCRPHRYPVDYCPKLRELPLR